MIWLWIIIGIIVLLVIADLAVANKLIDSALVRNPAMSKDPQPDDTPAWQDYYKHAEQGKAWILAQPHETCEIKSFDGLKLRATFLPADQATDRTILCIHGYQANGLFDFGAIAPFLHGLGYNLLLPDDRSHGASEGRYIGFGNLDSLDCIAWCRWLVGRTGPDSRIILYGLSMGGATVLAASGDPDLPAQVKGVVGDCGFASGYAEVAHDMKDIMHMPVWPFLPTADWLLQRRAGYSLRQRAAIDRVKAAKVPLLIIHGKADTFVPTAMGQAIYDAASGPKQLLLVDGAVHAHSYLTDTPAYQKAFSGFLARLDA